MRVAILEHWHIVTETSLVAKPLTIKRRTFFTRDTQYWTLSD